MKHTTAIFTFLFAVLSMAQLHCLHAADMREINTQAELAKNALIQKAENEKDLAQQQAAKSKAIILQDRSKLETAIKNVQQQRQQIETEIAAHKIEISELSQREDTISEKLAQTDQMIHELVGLIRINAKDVNTLTSENHQTALSGDSPEFLAQLADENNFPGMDGIRQLADTLIREIKKTGEVTRSVMPIIDRDGKTVEAEVLVLGPFCAVYRIDGEVGFLRYLKIGKQYYALSKLPPQRMQKQLTNYFDSKSESVPMDITRGAALQQLTHSLSFWEQVEKGGPIVWPILILFIAGLLIVLERIIFLLRHHFDSNTFMHQINGYIQNAQWDTCETYCKTYLKKPVARVINAGLRCHELSREDMENVLQEAILREIPSLERFLSTLGMLAAISPLLGLLGTVTGMIDTFHIITLHGTSDPKLMSGGISEALVTTMLGLGVAIPLMLAQTLLNRAVEKEIGMMEEKAVALVNAIHKSKL